MYLNKLIIINYRSCNLLEINFCADEPNIFIGINDCGKSTILKAIELLLSPKPNFNFIKDDKKKNDLSNTRASQLSISKLTENLKIPNFLYDDKKCYLLGQFKVESEEITEVATSNLSNQLLWTIENSIDSYVWIGKTFDECTQNIKDIIYLPDYYNESELLKLYNLKDSDLQKKRKEPELQNISIRNANDKGRFKKMEIIRAIYSQHSLKWYWVDYETKNKDAFYFPICRYLDWNFSFEQLTEIATDVINTKINVPLNLAVQYVDEQAKAAQTILNQELKNFTALFAKDIPNFEGLKANLSLQVKSTLTDFLINKKNTDGDIHLEQQGEGVKRQIWFSLIKWKALSSIDENINAKKIIWCFDEPETHLYPKAQRDFFDLIKSVSKGNVQSMISTHSTVFIDRAKFNLICRVELYEAYTTCFKCSTVPDIYNALQVKNSDFLFYDKFLIVEGDTEEFLIPHLFKIIYGEEKSLLNYGIQIINLGGKDKRIQNKAILENVLKDFNKIQENVVYLFDNDVMFDGLTQKELDELIHFNVGKQDIEDSFPIEFWYRLVNNEIPEANITIDEIKVIHDSIPNNKKINSNQKFYQKLRSELKKKLGDDLRYLVDERISDKGKKSATILAKHITDKSSIDSQIIGAFEKLIN